MRPARKINKGTPKKSPLSVELMVITRRLAERWEKPKFQRPYVEGKNTKELPPQIQDKRYILTAIYLGIHDGTTYLVDGQYRREALYNSGVDHIMAPVITKRYASGSKGMVDMCNDFILLQKHIKKPTANDTLRALEGVNTRIKEVRTECPFVGYANFRRRPNEPILSMAQAISAMVSSHQAAPGSWMGKSLAEHAQDMTASKTSRLIGFLKLAYEAWGADIENKSFWGPTNLGLCMWYYQQMVKGPGIKEKDASLTDSQFQNCLYSLVLNRRYRELLKGSAGGRMRTELRNPVCRELMKSFRKRLDDDGVKPYHVPKPSWLGL